MANELLRPTTDLVFKALFGQESSKGILISFLESVLHREDIESIVYLNPVFNIEDIQDKMPILDIRVKTSAGDLINVEVQVASQKHFSNRSLYYWAKMYGTQLAKGEGYDKLMKAVCINILDFKRFPDEEHFHSIQWLYFMKYADQMTKEGATDRCPGRRIRKGH